MTGDVLAWWRLQIEVCAVDLWRWLPGPWPVKILLLAVLAAGQYIPGELDEAAVHRRDRRPETPFQPEQVWTCRFYMAYSSDMTTTPQEDR